MLQMIFLPLYFINFKDSMERHRHIKEQFHYKPEFGGTSNTNQAYKYNGKELDCMLGLDWYYYGVRYKDAVKSVWTSILNFRGGLGLLRLIYKIIL